MLKQHLIEMERKCDSQMMSLENIQQDIKQLQFNDDLDRQAVQLETIWKVDSASFNVVSDSDLNTPLKDMEGYDGNAEQIAEHDQNQIMENEIEYIGNDDQLDTRSAKSI